MGVNISVNFGVLGVFWWFSGDYWGCFWMVFRFGFSRVQGAFKNNLEVGIRPLLCSLFIAPRSEIRNERQKHKLVETEHVPCCFRKLRKLRTYTL